MKKLEVYNEETLIESELIREFEEKKQTLLKEEEKIKKELIKLDEAIKTKKAKVLFVPKTEFLIEDRTCRLRDMLEQLKIIAANRSMKELKQLIGKQSLSIEAMEKYSLSENECDILYDFGGGHIYNKIRNRNASSKPTINQFR